MTRLDEREGRPGSADELGRPEEAPVYRAVGLSRDEVAELLTGRHVRHAEDGVWEVPIVLKSLRDAVETMVPVPLSHVNLNADLVGYVEEEAAEIPKKDPIRLVVLLPEAERAAADDGVLRALMRASVPWAPPPSGASSSCWAARWSVGSRTSPSTPRSPRPFRKGCWSWGGSRSGTPTTGSSSPGGPR